MARLEHENELLRLRLDRLEHEVRSMRPVVQQVADFLLRVFVVSRHCRYDVLAGDDFGHAVFSE